MRSSKLLPALLVATSLIQPAPSWAQAPDAFSTSDVGRIGTKPAKYTDSFLPSVATKLNRLWRKQNRPDYPDVLVRFHRGKHDICVAKANSLAKPQAAIQIQKISQLVTEAISSQPTPQDDFFCILFNFGKSPAPVAQAISKLKSPPVVVPKSTETPHHVPAPGLTEGGSADKAAASPPASMKQAGLLNNEGVRCLNGEDYQTAIKRFQEAMKIAPDYRFARENLAITYNKAALKLQPAQAIPYFHKALAVQPNDSTYRLNLNTAIKSLGKDPENAAVRLAMGRECKSQSDLDGARFEFQQAVEIENSGEAHIGLGDILRARGRTAEAISEYKAAIAAGGISDAAIGKTYTKLGQAYQAKQDILQAMTAYGEALKHKADLPEMIGAVTVGCEEAWVRRPDGSEVQTITSASMKKTHATGAQQDVDFGPYMAYVQRSLKKEWHPPKGSDDTCRVVVVFKIHAHGEVSDVRVDHSDGPATFDQAAINAVKAASPLRRLPAGAPENVDIQFTFDYNVYCHYLFYRIDASQPKNVRPEGTLSNRQIFEAPWIRHIR